MQCRNALFLIICILFSAFNSIAQQYPFVHYTPKDGLVSNRVISAMQDSRGKIYFSTYGGLSVYDGSRFTNYTTEDGLGSNHVNDVVEMGIDSLWVITNSTKITYLVHGILKEFITADKFCPTINKLIKCSDGFYYALADGGLYRFQNNRFVRMDVRDNNGIEINKYFVQGQEIDNKLFLITDGTVAAYPAPSHLVIYDIKTGVAFINKTAKLIGWVIKSPQNDILVSTSEGLKSIDKRSLRTGEIRFNPVPLLYRSGEKVIAHHLYFDREDNFWILFQKGIYRIDKEGNGKLFSTQNGLPVSAYTDVFQDQENSIWFINDQTGLSKLTYPSYELQPFADTGFHVTDMYADERSDSVWFLDRFLQKIVVKHPGGSEEFTIANKSRFIKILHGKGNTNYLLEGLSIYKYETTTASNIILPQLIYQDHDSSNGIMWALPDRNGNIVFCSNQINLVLPNKKVLQYPLGYLADQFVISGDLLWVITRANKLFAFRLHPENLQNYFELIKVYDKELPTLGARSITVDKKGNVWVGTREHGLFCFFIDQKMTITSWQQFTMKEGLSDNFITKLHCDASGTIWACSYAGLDKIQEKNKSFKIENITKGNDFYQSVFKVQTTKKGVVWASSLTAIIKIEPVPEIVKHYQAKILFTQIKVGKTKVNPLDKLSFSYKENDISFQLSAPTYIDEKQTRFSYRLKGSINNEWSEPSTEPDIRFINLGPGRYTLQVKASFLTGVYPDTETSYDFEILPPWWQTWWFKSLMVLVSITLLILIIRSYFKNKLEKQRKALEKQQAIEKERSRIALDMHDDLGAGLSTIRFLSEKVRRNTFNDITKTDIDKMVNTSNELVENMNEIIWAMNEKNDTLEDLLFYTRSYAKEYCEENNLDCMVHFPTEIPATFVSGELRRNVFLIVKESLHNIVKHAGATLVEIGITINGVLKVAIKDNGQGFSKENREGLSGGNGLKNMKKRVESIGGHFSSLNGQGVIIIIEVPLQQL